MVKPFSMGPRSSPLHEDVTATEDTLEASSKLLNRSTTSIIRGCAGHCYVD